MFTSCCCSNSTFMYPVVFENWWCCIYSLVMCDAYQYIKISIFSFNIVIQYWLLSVSLRYISGQFSKPCFSHLSNFIPKSNYNKLVGITLINFFYHFLTTITKQDMYLAFQISWYCLYRDIFGSDMHYYYLVVSHIPNIHHYC